MRKVRNVIVRYAIATIGLLLVAMGVALSIVSNLGTSPLSCPAYVMTGIWGLTVGDWTMIVNMSFMLAQLLILRKRFEAKYLMQIPATIVFGILIDFSMYCISWVNPVTIVSRLGLCLLACVLTAFGVSIEVLVRAWMLSAELTVYAVVKLTRKPFGPIKVTMDSLLVVISAVIALFLFSNPFGSAEYTGLMDILKGNSPGIVIGSGTLIMALLCGGLMKFTDPIIDRFMDWVFARLAYQNK